jgi:hypothetical protein
MQRGVGQPLKGYGWEKRFDALFEQSDSLIKGPVDDGTIVDGREGFEVEIEMSFDLFACSKCDEGSR